MVPGLKHTESTVQGCCKGTPKQPLFVQEKTEPDVLLPSPLSSSTWAVAHARAKTLLMNTQPENPKTCIFLMP